MSGYKRKGFTIVELLIVVVVIGILAAITIVAYNGIQSRSRDAQRVSEMDRLKKSLEVYFIDNGFYPQCSGTMNVCTSTGWNGNITTLPITSAPKTDPLNVSGAHGYYYAREHIKAATGSPTPTSDPKDYVIAMQLETNGGTVFSGWNSSTLNWYHSVNN